MTQERLLKRLAAWGREEAPAGDLGGYTESVLEDLDRLYNTQQGTALIDAEMGLPDFSTLFNSLAPPEMERIERALRQVTERFEPRLRIASVKHAQRTDDFGLLRFEVAARLRFGEQEVPLRFFALLGGEGRWRIQQ